jgi:hypothetical protein
VVVLKLSLSFFSNFLTPLSTYRDGKCYGKKKSLESKNKQQKLKGANMKILKNVGTKT